MKTLFISAVLSLSLLMGCELSAQSAMPKHTNFKEVWDLQKLGAQSQQQQLPIMLMFGAQWCEYCELLIEDVLEPMVISDLYDGKVVLMRHIGVDEVERIPDWQGNPIQKSKWAYELGADLTPTILFVDGTGKEIAPRIIGISEITLYTQLIHQSLNIAYKTMGLKLRIPATPELLELQTTQAKPH